MTTEPTRFFRSMLFVPASRPDRMRKALVSGADSVIFDLEDAVPVTGKADARIEVRTLLAEESSRAERSSSAARFVRLNAFGTGQLLADLTGVVTAGLDGVMLAKTESAGQVVALDEILTELELANRLPPSTVEIIPLTETPLGHQGLPEILASSPRVRRGWGVAGAAPAGDYHRGLGTEWTPEGLESLYFASRAVLASRALGFENVICGPSTAVRDLDLLEQVLRQNRRLGANGAQLIHPSHIPVAHAIFSPSNEEIEDARETILAMSEALADGMAAVQFKGRMIDYAHVRTSLDVLRRATSLGITYAAVPDVDILSYH
jgi:citrate lyase subunit beta / citryl-CoA lyase